MRNRRNRRLRKKLHLGEYCENGFEVGFGQSQKMSEVEVLAKISEVLINNGMAFLYEGRGNIFVSGNDSSLTVKDRECVVEWLKEQNDITSTVGSLIDAWHPPRGVRCFS